MPPHMNHIERRASRRPARQHVSDAHDHKPIATDPAVRRCLRFLRHGSIIWSGDSWKFGLATIGINVIEQLLADGRVVREGNEVRLAGQAR